MIKLRVDDFEQITMLELLLEKNGISYDLEINQANNGIRPPYLVVDGVPLDFNRSIKWIKEHGKHE